MEPTVHSTHPRPGGRSGLVLLAGAWLSGLWSGHALTPALATTFRWDLATAAAATICVGVVTRRPLRGSGLTMLLLTLMAGWFAGAAVRHPQRAAPPHGLARLTGRVLRCNHGAEGRASCLLLTRGGHRLQDGQPLAAGSRLRVGPYPLPEGAEVKLLAEVKPVVPFRNPTPHPTWPHPRADGLAFLKSADAARVLSIGPVHAFTGAARTRLRTRIGATTRAPYAAIARALLLGERGTVPKEISDAVTSAGLAHLLAVSGLHVALLVGAALWALQRLLLWIPAVALRCDPERLACALGMPFALLLALVCGAGPSALRAAATAALGFGLRALGRRPAAVPLAATAAIAVTALDPADASRVGLVLSVVATAAIVSAGGGNGVRGALRAGLQVTLRTTIATAPIVLWCFGAFPVSGLLTNIVGVPWFSMAVLPTAALHGLTASLSTDAARVTGWLFERAADPFLWLCRLAADHVGNLLPPPLTLPQVGVLSLACALALSTRLRTGTRAIAIAACCLGWIVAEVHVRQVERPLGRLRVTFLDVGQGDAALVDLPDGRLMLVDAGGAPGGGPDPGARVLRPLLAARRRSHIDVAVLSHPHPDHYGGLAALAALPMGELWDSGQAESEADIFAEHRPAVNLIAARRAGGTRVLTPSELCGPARELGGVRVEVLWPCPGHDPGLSPNDNSLVIRLSLGRRAVLFTGDVEAAAEGALIARNAHLRADVLKVPHHGSRTSSGAGFLARVSPHAAVVSAGRFNRYGHPHAPVVARLGAAGIRVFNLATRGGTIFETDGVTAELRSVDGTRVRLPPAKGG